MERNALEMRSLQAQISELGESLQTRNREKDLMMATYCRLIKENERLHADLLRTKESSEGGQR